MADVAPTRVTGRCFCGAVRFAVELPTLFCAHCHCSMCRRIHGAAYVTWFRIPYARFHLLAGAERLVRFPSSDHGTRSFCGACGAPLLCESTRHPELLDVTLASLDGPLDRQPQFHVFFDDRAPWTHVGDDLPRLGGPSGLEPR